MSQGHFGFKEFGQGLAGMVTGAATMAAVTVPRVLRRLPRAVASGHRRIQSENRVGPNVRNVASAALPVAAAVMVPLSAAGSLLYGLGAGTYHGISETPDKVAKRLSDQASTVDRKFVEEVLPGLDEFKPEALPDGETPFDISPLRAAKAFATGIGTAVVEAPALTGVYLRHAPNIWWEGSKALFKEGDMNMFLFSVLGEIVLTKGVVLLAPITLFGSTLFSLGAGCKRGYQKGVGPAFQSIADDVRKADKFLTDTMAKAK